MDDVEALVVAGECAGDGNSGCLGQNVSKVGIAVHESSEGSRCFEPRLVGLGRSPALIQLNRLV